MLYLCTRHSGESRDFFTKTLQMLNKAIMYAKLAWVYAKGMCGLRRRVYDLQFVYVPEDKTWYIDMRGRVTAITWRWLQGLIGC